MLNRSTPTATSRSTRARIGLAAAAVAFTVLAGGPARAAADCPWLVKPLSGLAMASQQNQPEAYTISFEGPAFATQWLYGFSVTSADLAWKLIGRDSMPSLDGAARALRPVSGSKGGAGYLVAADTLQPHVIYLVTSREPVQDLEAIDARLDPPRAMALSQTFPRTRGASDLSGPLPELTVPGYLIAEAKAETVPDLQICAYQLAG